MSTKNIDDFVIEAAKSILEIWNSYYKTEWFIRGAKIIRYEDVWDNKELLVHAVAKAMNVSLPMQVLKEIAAKNDIRPVIEDVNAHIRKGVPGDHREKLKLETIAFLDSELQSILEFGGYIQGAFH